MTGSTSSMHGERGAGATAYRAALRRHPAGVAVITMASLDGPVGFTATSLASLSLDPPLVSFNITHTSSSMAALRRAGSLIIHILDERQVPLAQRFAGSAELRFADPTLWTTLDTGEPLLHDTPTWLRTEPRQLLDIGDSTLVVGFVTDAHCAPEHRDGPSSPLIYHSGAYLQATRISP